MARQRPYRKQFFPLTAGTWTPIQAPIDCNVFWVKTTTAAIRESTDDSPDGNSAYEVIAPGELQYLPNYLAAERAGWVRFNAGDLVTNLTADSVDTVAIVTFVL